MDARVKFNRQRADQLEQYLYAGLRQQAISRHRVGDIDQARNAYHRCLTSNPLDSKLWCNLGVALRKQKLYQSAINCYRRALEIAPNDIAVIGNLANAFKDLHRLDEALALHETLMHLSSDNVQILMNYAFALRAVGEFAQGLTLLDAAQSLDPDNAMIEWERAQHLLYLGCYSEGWQAFEARWHTGELAARHYPYPQWRGEPLKDKSILLHTEQGYGDTILAARFIKILTAQGAHVTLQLKPELHQLFKKIGAEQLIVADNVQGHAEQPPPGMLFDFHSPLMSIMAALDIQTHNIPPPSKLYIPSVSIEKMRFISEQYPACLKVGIVWSGSLTFANNENRSVSLERFLPFAEIPGVRLYSLQKGPKEQDIKRYGAESYIENLGARCDHFADTAAAVSQLDVVVMTDSSVAHLAASLGKPVINLLQAVPYWLYALQPDKTPWYPSMRLIKQQQAGQWDAVFDRAATLIQMMADDKQSANHLLNQKTL